MLQSILLEIHVLYVSVLRGSGQHLPENNEVPAGRYNPPGPEDSEVGPEDTRLFAT